MRHETDQATENCGFQSIKSQLEPKHEIKRRRRHLQFVQNIRWRGLTAKPLVYLTTAYLDEQRRSELMLAVWS